jgi:hypothetical protein
VAHRLGPLLVWGYNTGVASYFAQLYRNHVDDPDDIPHIWLDGHHSVFTTENELALAIAATVGATVDDVANALHLDHCRRDS